MDGAFVSSHVEKDKTALWKFLYNASTLITYSPFKGPTSSYYHITDEVLKYELVENINIQMVK
jgi:hypothetical protein